MFKLLRRRKEKPSVMFGVLAKMSSAAEKKQRKAADYLNAKASVFSLRQLKIGLFLFCIFFGGCSLYVIWRAFDRSAAIVRVKSITIPEHVIIPDRDSREEGMLTKEEVTNIKSFQHFLDSLQQTAEGKAAYDSIARHRRGLLDSLAFIKQFYSEQLK